MLEVSLPIELKNLMDKPEWQKIGERVKGYRLIKGLSTQNLSQKLGTSEITIKKLEQGRPSPNLLWDLICTENLSIRWLYTGSGEYYDNDPPEYLPPTIINKRGAGIRFSEKRKDADEGSFVGDTFEFVLAVDAYKTTNKKPFPSWTEIYELFISLGYRKVASPKINPTGSLT